MEWGSKAEWLESLKKAGMEPEALRQRPKLAPAAEWFYTSFLILNRGRQAGMASNPIALTEIESLLRMLKVADVEECLRFTRVMAKMDSVVLEHLRNRSTA